MNKIALHLRIAVIAVGLFSTLTCAAENSDELEKVRLKVSSMFEEIGPEDVQPSPLDGWYMVRKGAIIAYISGDGRYLMQGDMIDLDLQINVTDMARNAARVDMLAAIPDENKIRFTPKNVRYTVTVFTDIDCTYCRKLHSQINDYLAEGIEIKYLLYPRNGPASPSWVKAEQVWCADDRGEALTLAKVDKSFETHECDSSMVSTHYSLGRDIGLTGTPAIVTEDGTLMPGYLPPDRLLAQLEASKLAAAN